MYKIAPLYLQCQKYQNNFINKTKKNNIWHIHAMKFSTVKINILDVQVTIGKKCKYNVEQIKLVLKGYVQHNSVF